MSLFFCFILLLSNYVCKRDKNPSLFLGRMLVKENHTGISFIYFGELIKERSNGRMKFFPPNNY